MTSPLVDPQFVAALSAAQRLIDRYDGRGLIIGGVAVGLVGEARFTSDIDLMILLEGDEEEITHLLGIATAEALIPRISDAAEFARLRRILLLKHEPTDTRVDLSLGILPFEHQAVERGTVRHAYGIQVRVPTPEDLIIFKAVARRPLDLIDIQRIAERYPALDRDYIERWIREFGALLERHELWDEIAPLLQ